MVFIRNDIRSLYRFLGALTVLLLVSHVSAADLPGIAFYYGDHAPVGELACMDRVVVENEHISDADLHTLQARGARVHAYVSVGEAEPWRRGYAGMSKKWFLARNPDWNSDIADLANPDYRRFLLDERIQPLWDRGFRAFFLDTLDSYQRLDPQKVNWQAQQNGLVQLIHALAQRFTGAQLVLNRGFEVLERLKDVIHGVAAESLFRGWDPRQKKFICVSEKDRHWLCDQLLKARDQFGLEVYAVDYVPAGQRDLARQTARQIAGLGISPWVSVPQMDLLGVGLREFMPRQVLVLYDDDTGRDEIEQLAMLLDYFGYVTVYQHTRQGLPQFRLAGRCAGLISCLHNNQPAEYINWLQRQVTDGVRVLMLAEPGMDAQHPLLKTFGLAPVEATPPFRVINHDALYGFEMRLDQTAAAVPGLQSIAAANRVHLQVADRNGTLLTPVVSGTWGALALYPWSHYSGAGDKPRWVIDPFRLVKTALDLPDIPMPDVTTENGQRIWIAHIDGDGFLNRAELPGTPLAGEVIRSRILEKYPYPTTVSIIEGEIGPAGLYPQLSPQAEAIARRIFRLPTVEAASHTYSHPFDWQEIRRDTAAEYHHNLPIKGYRFSLDREIRGSVAYMEKNLLPAGKRVKVLLWSGNCLPTEAALRMVRQAGLFNLNGGDTTIRKDRPFLFNVTPIFRPVGRELQVYAPIMNENVFTNLWTGPFYGFRRVIETFELTDQPRRLKPIDIYYHFYSGSKTASLRALQTVYDWTLNQQILPMFASEYLQRVQAWRQAMVFRELSGSLTYEAPAALRTLRQVDGACSIDLSRCANVAGFRQLQDGTYLALSGGTRTRLAPGTPNNPQTIRLVRANGVLTDWQQPRGTGPVRFSMQGYRPLELVVDGPGTCRLTVSGQDAAGVRTKEGWRFNWKGQRLKGAQLVCR